MEFSKRTRWDLRETPWARLLRELRASGADLVDLTASNPTLCGLQYDEKSILQPLSNPRSLEYHPQPRGLFEARCAISEYYSAHGARVGPEDILLTTSTSEAYSFLFRLLCDPGDEILIAQPSYPLFDFLAQIEDVRLTSYPLFYDYGWHIDLETLRRRFEPLRSDGGLSGEARRPKAVVLVHPNNPTGHFTTPGQRAELEEICREHGAALIVDEVFLDYKFEVNGCVDGASGNSDSGSGGGSATGNEEARSFAAGEHSVPTFVLSGLSKVAALPQMKAAWIACLGPGREESLERLEVISDTFLSMNAPVQHALPTWLQGRRSLQGQLRSRVQKNLMALDGLLAQQSLVSRLAMEGGWYAILRIPANVPDERTARDLLAQRGVALHPGFFFGFPESGWIVVSLILQNHLFTVGIEKILEHFSAQHGNEPN